MHYNNSQELKNQTIKMVIQANGMKVYDVTMLKQRPNAIFRIYT